MLFKDEQGLILLIDRGDAFNHVFLSEVYVKHLSKEYKIWWIIRSKKNMKSDINNKIFYVKSIFSYIKTFFILKKIIKSQNIKIIQTRNHPFFFLLSLFISKLNSNGIKTVYQFTNLMAEEFYYNSKLTNNIFLKCILIFKGWIYKVGAIFCMRYTDLIFPISEGMFLYLKDIYHIPIEKMTPLPLCVPDTPIKTTKNNKSPDKVRDKIIAYMGKIDEGRNIPFIFEVFDKVQTVIPDARLLIVGGTPKEIQKLNRFLCGGKNIDKITFTGWVPRYKAYEILQDADVCLSCIPPFTIANTTKSPIKLKEYLYLVKPVVANIEIEEQKKILTESGGGLLANYNATDFAECIIKLLNNPQMAMEMGKKGQEYILRNYSAHNLARIVKNEYQRLLLNEVLYK
jgi:glycosyltransferase involved in cell wall biosynthesis